MKKIRLVVMIPWMIILLILISGTHLRDGKRLPQGKKREVGIANGKALMVSCADGIGKAALVAKKEDHIGQIQDSQENILNPIDNKRELLKCM